VNHQNLMTLAATVAMVLLLGGCATAPRHERFEASWPEELPRTLGLASWAKSVIL
jgi:hypothetical protein